MEQEIQRPVGEVAAVDQIRDAVESDRPTDVDQVLLVIGVQHPFFQAAASRQAADRVGKPARDAAEIVIGDDLRVLRPDSEVLLAARRPRELDVAGVDEVTGKSDCRALAGALLASYHEHRVGPAWPQGGNDPADVQLEIGAAHVDETPQFADPGRSVAGLWHRQRA